MVPKSKHTFSATLGSVLLLSPAWAFSCEPREVITKDVCILGGGASGTFAAVKLHDLGKSVAVIEEKPTLGGHTSTYIDSSGRAVDYGVAQYQNLDVTREFFQRLEVSTSLTPPGRPEGESAIFDFEHSKLVDASTLSPSTSKRESVNRYRELLDEYAYLDEGYHLPDPVPEDVLLPFGEFIQKHGIDGILPVVWVAMGDILHLPTIYVLKHIGREVIDTNFIWTQNYNREIFDKALDILQGEVFLSTRVSSLARESPSNVSVCLDGPQGQILLQAQKLLVSIPPQLENLRGFDLTNQETALFQQFRNVGYYTSLVRIPGLPANRTMYANNNPGAPYDLPPLPALYRVITTKIPDVYQMEYGANHTISEDYVKDNILRCARSLQDAVGDESAAAPEFVRFGNHSPFLMHVSAEAIRSGFYRDLNSLQGQTNTFWTGAAFHINDSPLLWRFTQTIIENMIAEGL